MFPFFTASITPYSGMYQYLPTYNYNICYPLIGNLLGGNAGSYISMPYVTSQNDNFFAKIAEFILRPIRSGSSKTEKSPATTYTTLSQSTTSAGYNKNTLPAIRNSHLMKNVPAQTKAQILDAVDRACKQYNVDPNLVISMMYVESAFNPRATSRCGAQGLMQLMPETARQYGAKNPYDIEQNIFAAVKFIKDLSKRYNGRRDLIAAAYNAGPGRVKNSVPNIGETKKYVAKVNTAYRQLA